jgi:hypothetical protein
MLLLVKITESGVEEPTSCSILHMMARPDPPIPQFVCYGPIYATVNHLFVPPFYCIVELV